MSAPNVHRQISLPLDWDDALMKLAHERDVSASSIVRELLEPVLAPVLERMRK